MIEFYSLESKEKYATNKYLEEEEKKKRIIHKNVFHDIFFLLLSTVFQINKNQLFFSLSFFYYLNSEFRLLNIIRNLFIM